jgi:hypothetical protein
MLTVMTPEPSRRHLPEWSGDFARQALANAVGTLMALLVVFLAGVVFGAIQDVPARSVIAAVVALAGVLVAAVATVKLADAYPRYRRARKALDAVEAVQRPAERAERAYGRLDAEFEDGYALIARANEARERGDMEEFARLDAALDAHVSAMRFATQEADRYGAEAHRAVEEAMRVLEEHGYGPPDDTETNPDAE